MTNIRYGCDKERRILELDCFSIDDIDMMPGTSFGLSIAVNTSEVQIW